MELLSQSRSGRLPAEDGVAPRWHVAMAAVAVAARRKRKPRRDFTCRLRGCEGGRRAARAGEPNDMLRGGRTGGGRVAGRARVHILKKRCHEGGRDAGSGSTAFGAP